MARRNVGDSSWLEQVSTIQAPAPIRQVEAPTARRRLLAKIMVYSALVLGALSAVVAISMMLNRPADTAATIAGESGPNTPGYNAAQASLARWIDEQQIIDSPYASWTGGQSTTLADGGVQWLHLFDVLTPQGARYIASVNVLVSPDGTQVTVLGSPSVWAVDSSPNVARGSDIVWPNTVQARHSDAVVAAIEMWGKAYTGVSPTELRLAVGDKDATRFYAPLGQQAVYEGVRVMSAANPVDAQGAALLDALIVNVRLEFANPSDPQGDSEAVAYDLLISEADTAAPHVVAWGGRGTGHLLSPYDNAVGYELSELRLIATPDVSKDGEK